MPRLKSNLPVGYGRFTRTPNYLLDRLLPTLRDTELRVLLVVTRATTGWNRDGRAVEMSYRQLAQRTGRSRTAIVEALRSLERHRLIHSSLSESHKKRDLAG